MSDYDSGLAIRSESDGADERVQVKIVDQANPDTQKATVDTDNNLHVEVHGDNPASGDEILRLGELGQLNPDGDYDATNNTKPASIGLLVHDRATTPVDTAQNIRVTGIQGTADDTRHCQDIALHDEKGDAFNNTNPLPVSIEDSAGVEVQEYNSTAAVVKDATTDHDHSIADGDVFSFKAVWASASGKIKVEVQIGDGAASEVFTTKFVGFNSTANPNVFIDISRAAILATGTVNTTTIRLVITNLDNQAQDVYSTILGVTI